MGYGNGMGERAWRIEHRVNSSKLKGKSAEGKRSARLEERWA
jgi:hypothetical protein